MDNPPFLRRVEDDPNASEIIGYFTRIDGFNVLYSHIAEHCGVLYSHFIANDSGLKEAAKLAAVINAHIHVAFIKENDRVEYQIAFGNTLEYTLRTLRAYFDPDWYMCPGCESMWKWGNLLIDSKCPKCQFQLDKKQDRLDRYE